MATMKELREECAKLGITPGRSIAECERRIAEENRERERRAAARQVEVQDSYARTVALFGNRPSWHVRDTGTGECFGPYATEEEANNLRKSKSRMEPAARYVVERATPRRMSRTARMLCDCTAICGSLARNPLIYSGDQQRHDYAIMGGWQAALLFQARAMARGLVARRR